MKKFFMLSAALFVSNIYASSINIDIDLGSIGNILEKKGNIYYKAFFDNNGNIHKSDIRLRNALNASLSSSGYSAAGINAIYNLERGFLKIVNPNAHITLSQTVSTAGGAVVRTDFAPGIEIYSSNNIQIKRGYLFSQEFLKFFDLNILFEQLKNFNYDQNAVDQETKLNEGTVLLLLDKFNIRSFSLFYSNATDAEYNNILNGLSNLKAMVDNEIKKSSYRDLLKNKINSITALLKTAKAIYDASKNETLRVNRYTIIKKNCFSSCGFSWGCLRNCWNNENQGGEGALQVLNNNLTLNLKIPYIDIFKTNDGTIMIDKTHIIKVLTQNKYVSSGYYYDNCLYGWDCYYDYDDEYTQYSQCTPQFPNTSNQDVIKSYEKNCIVKININQVKNAVKGVLSDLNGKYEQSVNEILKNASHNLTGNSNSRIKDIFKYLTNNIPNLTNIFLSASQSFATRDINALYRDSAHINMLDFMDDIQELIALKQYKYDKYLDVLRIYPTAVSLSDFSNNTIQKVTPEDLQKEVSEAINTSEEINQGGGQINPDENSNNSNDDSYIPLTIDNFLSQGSDGVADNLSEIPLATTSDNPVQPEKLMIFYFNSFNKGAYKNIFGNAQTVSLIDNAFSANYDNDTLRNYDIFSYALNKNDNKKYYLDSDFFDDNEKYMYLINSFALFGLAPTDIGDGNKVISITERHVDSTDEWIDLGENNYMTLYNMLLNKISANNNVNLDKNELTATINEITGILVDKTTGETSQKLVDILNGKGNNANESMSVDTFMPFKAQGLLIQKYYEIDTYVPEPETHKKCQTQTDQNGNSVQNCVNITTYHWKLIDRDYEPYSCQAGIKPVSHVSDMLIKKIYGNYVNGQMSTTGYSYKNIGMTDGFDFAVFLKGDPQANNNNTFILGNDISYDYKKSINPDSQPIELSDTDCLAHGFDSGCNEQQVGTIVKCSEIAIDDFWATHGVIHNMQTVNIPSIGSSKLIYKHDWDNLSDQTKQNFVDPEASLLYSFNGKMPGIGTSHFNDDTNIYKKIFIDGDWKFTVLTDTKTEDLNNENSAGIIVYNCNGTYQTTMCSDDQLPPPEETPVDTGNDANETTGSHNE